MKQDFAARAGEASQPLLPGADLRAEVQAFPRIKMGGALAGVPRSLELRSRI
jgi:hypothetical protein